MTEQNFPLYEETVSILKKRDKKLAWLMERVGPLSHTDLKDGFLFFIEQVIGQMLSIQVADVLPYEDATFLAAYKWLYRTRNVKPEAVKRRCRKWSPYSSVAAMYLYTAFDGKLIATESPKLKEL